MQCSPSSQSASSSRTRTYMAWLPTILQSHPKRFASCLPTVGMLFRPRPLASRCSGATALARCQNAFQTYRTARLMICPSLSAGWRSNNSSAALFSPGLLGHFLAYLLPFSRAAVRIYPYWLREETADSLLGLDHRSSDLSSKPGTPLHPAWPPRHTMLRTPAKECRTGVSVV